MCKDQYFDSKQNKCLKTFYSRLCKDPEGGQVPTLLTVAEPGGKHWNSVGLFSRYILTVCTGLWYQKFQVWEGGSSKSKVSPDSDSGSCHLSVLGVGGPLWLGTVSIS